jgi:cytochrome c oxidase subunit III
MAINSLTYARGNPYNLMLWLALAGSGLVFFFLILVFSTRTGGMDWAGFPIPQAFTYSTITIVLSSVSLQLANRSFKHENFSSAFRWHSLTFWLAIAFCMLQVAGWMRLMEQGVIFADISGAFFYLLSGLHFIHLVFGLMGLGWILLDSYRFRSYLEGFIRSLNPMTITRLRLFTTYWHFVDVLWLVLFILLQLNYK